MGNFQTPVTSENYLRGETGFYLWVNVVGRADDLVDPHESQQCLWFQRTAERDLRFDPPDPKGGDGLIEISGAIAVEVLTAWMRRCLSIFQAR
jgi:hypothetical protein